MYMNIHVHNISHVHVTVKILLKVKTTLDLLHDYVHKYYNVHVHV